MRSFETADRGTGGGGADVTTHTGGRKAMAIHCKICEDLDEPALSAHQKTCPFSTAREGPRLETRIMCGGCKFLDTRKRYGFVCVHPEIVREMKDADALRDCRSLPMRSDQTPEWCPFYPAS